MEDQRPDPAPAQPFPWYDDRVEAVRKEYVNPWAEEDEPEQEQYDTPKAIYGYELESRQHGAANKHQPRGHGVGQTPDREVARNFYGKAYGVNHLGGPADNKYGADKQARQPHGNAHHSVSLISANTE